MTDNVVRLKPKSIRVNLPFEHPPTCSHDPGTAPDFHCEICSDPDYDPSQESNMPQAEET